MCYAASLLNKLWAQKPFLSPWELFLPACVEVRSSESLKPLMKPLRSQKNTSKINIQCSYIVITTLFFDVGQLRIFKCKLMYVSTPYCYINKSPCTTRFSLFSMYLSYFVFIKTTTFPLQQSFKTFAIFQLVLHFPCPSLFHSLFIICILGPKKLDMYRRKRPFNVKYTVKVWTFPKSLVSKSSGFRCTFMLPSICYTTTTMLDRWWVYDEVQRNMPFSLMAYQTREVSSGWLQCLVRHSTIKLWLVKHPANCLFNLSL